MRRYTPACGTTRRPEASKDQPRHTFATIALANGVPVPTVAEILGYSSPTITMTIYADVLPGTTKAAVDMVSGVALGNHLRLVG